MFKLSTHQQKFSEGIELCCAPETPAGGAVVPVEAPCTDLR